MIDTAVGASATETQAYAATDPDADGDQFAVEPWTGWHRYVLAATAEPPSLAWNRILAVALTLALHLAVLLRLTLPPSLPPPTPTPTPDTRRSSTAPGEPADRLQLEFVEAAAPADPGDLALATSVVPPAPPSTPVPLSPAPAAPALPRRRPALADSNPPVVAPPATAAPGGAAIRPGIVAAPAPAARLFRPDGSIALPAAVIADLGAVESADRVFDYAAPGRADAAAAFQRLPTLPYTPTRFDADWQPVRTLADDILLPIANLLTYQNERKTFRCSLLPPVCTWGRVDAAVKLDDPHTLNPAEDAQCRGLWEAIVAATDQAEWLARRKRFDSECRKPLERDGAPPASPAVVTAPGTAPG